MGKKFAPRTDLFGTCLTPFVSHYSFPLTEIRLATTTPAVPIKRGRGRPRKTEQTSTKPKTASSKSAISKDIKARLATVVKQGSPTTPSLESSSGDSSSGGESEEDESEEEEEMRGLVRFQDVRIYLSLI